MEIGSLNGISFDIDFLTSLLSIVIIDLVLAGDNAVVMAMAVRSLPREKRKRGILFGAGAAVLLRVVITSFIAQVLHIHFLKLAGGLWITWAAVKLFTSEWTENISGKETITMMQVIKTIVIADITMSLDNMLAVGGASQGNLLLIIFGLSLSIPFVIVTSNLLSTLMDKYPVIIYIGAAILGKVGGEMIMTDAFIVNLIKPGRVLTYSIQAAFAIGVIAAGKLWMKWKFSREEKEEYPNNIDGT